MGHNSFDIKKDLLENLNHFVKYFENYLQNDKIYKSPNFNLMNDLKGRKK